VLTGNGGDVYHISASASYDLWLSSTNPAPVTSPADPSIKVLDSTGTRMTTCNDPLADNPPANAPFAKGAGNYTDACVNHGGYTAGSASSSLTLQLPAGTSRSTFMYSISKDAHGLTSSTR